MQGQERPCDDCDSALCLYGDCEYIFAAERAAVAVVCVCCVTYTARVCATVKCKMRSMESFDSDWWKVLEQLFYLVVVL